MSADNKKYGFSKKQFPKWEKSVQQFPHTLILNSNWELRENIISVRSIVRAPSLHFLTTCSHKYVHLKTLKRKALHSGPIILSHVNIKGLDRVSLTYLFPRTLLTACRAFLHSSYCEESLGVFWQIVCNKGSESANHLIYNV